MSLRMSTRLVKLPELSSRQLSKAAVGQSQRQISSSSVLWNRDNGNKKPNKPQQDKPNDKLQRPPHNASRQQSTPPLIRSVYNTQPSADQPSADQPSTNPGRAIFRGPPPNAAADTLAGPRDGPRGGSRGGRPVDARTFGPQRRGGGNEPNQSPASSSASLQELRERLRSRQNKFVRNGQGGSSRQGAGGDRRQQQRRGRRRRRTDGAPNSDGNILDDPTKQYMLEKQEAERPKAVRYNPEPYTFEKLKRTWPSLPIGESAGTAGSVRDKLTWYGERYVGSFESPHDLANRVFDGKRVMFASEEEKDQVIRITKELAEQKAKAESKIHTAPEPEDVSFQPLTEHERMDLIGSLVAGQYDKVDTSGPYAEVQRNLGNNSTYYRAQNTQFMKALSKFLPKGGQGGQNKAKATR